MLENGEKGSASSSKELQFALCTFQDPLRGIASKQSTTCNFDDYDVSQPLFDFIFKTLDLERVGLPEKSMSLTARGDIGNHVAGTTVEQYLNVCTTVARR